MLEHPLSKVLLSSIAAYVSDSFDLIPLSSGKPRQAQRIHSKSYKSTHSTNEMLQAGWENIHIWMPEGTTVARNGSNIICIDGLESSEVQVAHA